MEKDFDSQKNKSPKHFGSKHKIAAILIAPLLIATFISIISLRAEIYSRPQNIKFKNIIAKIVKMFDHNSLHKTTWHSLPPKINPIESAVDTYFLNTGQYPTTLDDLIVDPNLDGWAGPYLKLIQVNDEFGNPFIYITDGKGRYRLISYGADGEFGGEGDNADVIYDY